MIGWLDPDPGGQNQLQKLKKVKKYHVFVLGVLVIKALDLDPDLVLDLVLDLDLDLDLNLNQELDPELRLNQRGSTTLAHFIVPTSSQSCTRCIQNQSEKCE